MRVRSAPDEDPTGKVSAGRVLAVIAATLGALGLLAFLTTRVSITDTASAASSAHRPLLALALGAMACSTALSALTVRRACAVADAPVTMRRALGAQAAGQVANAVAPTALAEAVRLSVLAEGRHGPIVTRAGAMVAQRAVESLCVFAIIAACAPFCDLPGPLAQVSWLPAAALGLIVATIVGARRLGLTARLATSVPPRVRDLVTRLSQGARALGRTREVVRLAALQMGAILSKILGVGLLLAAFGLPGEPSTAIVVFSLMAATAAIPTPGGAGAREAAVVPALVAAAGAPSATALAFSLSVQLIGLAAGAALVVALGAIATPRVIVRAFAPAPA